MGTALSELFNQLNARSLTFRRTPVGELEIVGDTGLITDDIRKAVSVYRQTILDCIPAQVPAGEQENSAVCSASEANAIQIQIDAFRIWLGESGPWIQSEFLDRINRKLDVAVATQRPCIVKQAIEEIRDQVEALNWAETILPSAD